MIIDKKVNEKKQTLLNLTEKHKWLVEKKSLTANIFSWVDNVNWPASPSIRRPGTEKNFVYGERDFKNQAFVAL